MRFQHDRMHYFALLAVLSWLPSVHAQSAPEGLPLNNAQTPSGATDAAEQGADSRWGLGAGIAALGLPYKGFGTRVSPVPFAFYDSRWISFTGAALDLKGWQEDGFTFSLRTKFSLFDGYSHSDATIFHGMADRNGALWYGPHIAWHYGQFRISSEYLFSSRGQQGALSFERGFHYGRWRIAPHLQFDYMNRKYVDYYYGVRSNEATLTRPVYAGKSTANVTAGVSATRRLDARQAIRGDVGVTRFGTGITDSPLVGKKTAPSLMLGYIYRFR